MILMRWSILLILAGVCLSFRPPTQSDILQRPVTLDYQAVTLAQILHDLRDRYQVKFAYLNNELPESRFSIRVKDQALGLVLDELLVNTGLSYEVINEQVVLKKKVDFPSSPTASPVRSGETRYRPTPKDSSPDTTASVPPPANNPYPVPQLVPTTEDAPPPSASAPDILIPEVSLAQKPTRIASHAVADNVKIVPVDAVPASTVAVQTVRPSSAKEDQPEANPRSRRSSKFGQQIGRNVRRAMDKLLQGPSVDSVDYLHRLVHLGMIYPLSTNGILAGRTVNRLSLHLLIGYAAGLDGAEFSAVGNIENDFTEGAQFAGFFNLVRHRVNGVQAAGFVNANGGDTRGAQLSGFVNVGAGTVNGLQGTGFVNVATGAQRGAQLSGFVNLLTDSIRGVQGTGFVNVATRGVHGAQLSGFVNYTHHLKGLQATGFVNVASGDVQGAQLAGFINYAHHVKGAQIGLFNVADSIDGVPIGLVSVVRKNGYRRLELWYGEALQANVAVKMGVSRFYNLLVFGTQFADTDFRWGVGYGVGTLLPITSVLSTNLDLFAMQIHEDDQRGFGDYPLNLLTTLRLSFNLQLAKHLALFAAPTFNVMVSEYRQPDSGLIGSPIAPSRTVYDRTFNDRTNLKMWPGFHVGLRF